MLEDGKVVAMQVDLIFNLARTLTVRAGTYWVCADCAFYVMSLDDHINLHLC